MLLYFLLSVIDQQLKQTIAFSGGTKLGNFEGQLYVTGASSLHCLMPRPWTSQVMVILLFLFRLKSCFYCNAGANISIIVFLFLSLFWCIFSFMLQTLLENESVEEAVELTDHSGGAGMTSEQYLQFTFDVFRRAGFVKFSQCCFQEAQDYFIRGRLDIREVCSLKRYLISVIIFLYD